MWLSFFSINRWLLNWPKAYTIVGTIINYNLEINVLRIWIKENRIEQNTVSCSYFILVFWPSFVYQEKSSQYLMHQHFTSRK